MKQNVENLLPDINEYYIYIISNLLITKLWMLIFSFLQLKVN